MMNHERFVERSRFDALMYRVYAWMGIGLAITAISSWMASTSAAFMQVVTTNVLVMIGLVVAQFALVLALSFFLPRLSFPVAAGCFVLYSLLTGLMLSSIFIVFTQASLVTTFIITAGTFVAMSLYGYFTKADLSTMGNTMLMMLFGLIIAMVVNMFVKSTRFELLISAVGVVVFTLLTAFDTQKIKVISSQIAADANTMGKIALFGALTLYLDFINLFLFLLRFTGKQRD